MQEALREVECLALDDLGMQKDSGWVGERLYEIINDRYNAGRQIVMTTNARNMEQLASMIGTSGHQIASRLSQMTATVIIEAPDYRKKLAKMPAIPEKEAV
jgi:DNA replication protein DnaC